MPGRLKFWSFWPLFLLKSQFFCHLPIRGQWKCHFDPILTHFEPSWAQTFGPWPKCAYLGPLPWMDLGGTLRDPILTLILTILDPFWGSWGGCGWSPHYELPLGWRTCLEPLKPMPKTPNFGHFWPLSLLKKVNFVILPIGGSVKMPFWPYFWPHFEPSWGPEPLASCQNVPFWRTTALEGPWRTLRDPIFWPNFDHFGPSGTLLRVLEEVQLGPQAAFGLEDLLRALKPMPGPQILVILTTFPIEKVNFVILPIRGQWKCHFDPILTPFWALLSPNFFGLPPKCAYLGPLPWMDLGGPSRDPNLTLFLTILDPFWGSWREVAAGPLTSCLWAEGPAQSLSNPCPGTSNFGHFDHFWPHFGSKTGSWGVRGLKADISWLLERRLSEVLKRGPKCPFSIKMTKNHQKSRNLRKCASKQWVQIHGFL